MKITLLTITIILFSLQLRAQTPNFIGKWVQVKYEVYTSENLEETIKSEVPNKACLNYTEFTNDGIVIVKRYNNNCKEESLTTKTYKYNDDGNLWELFNENGFYEGIINKVDNKLQITHIISELLKMKMIVYYENYDSY